MNTSATLSLFDAPKVDFEKRHRLRVIFCYALASSLILALTLYGFDYYFLDSNQRPFSAKHLILKPSGSVGLSLGLLGLALFLGIFLYPLRKRWDWLRRIGNTKHWLDFHIVLGLTAPFVIAFHASFKFRGLAGMAFWIMSAVAASGVVGRYLYGQIPRSLSAAELSLKELEALRAQLTEQLAAQRLIPAASLAPLFRLPSAAEVQAEPTLVALFAMAALDVKRAVHIARLRLRTAKLGETVATLGGVFATKNRGLEEVIETARAQAALSKRILFLAKSQQVFHLWHVVHKPFSYSFAVLAAIHIIVVMLFGIR
ncbi:MAG: hypothetical protein ACE145_06295 [Terriglobia bacterium]